MHNQHTIKSEVKISGVGLHTGKEVNVTFCPAEENTGIKFLRTDIAEDAIIKADCDLVNDSSRGTSIKKGEIEVATVEHVLAAIAGLSIDNVLIKLDQTELPIMDGSAKPFTDLLQNAGIVEQTAERKYFELTENIEFYDADKKVHMLAIPSDKFELTVRIDFNSTTIGSQFATINDISEFIPQIANARTFCFLHELKHLLDNNLIKGGDINNAIVVVDKLLEENELKELAKKFNREEIEVKETGILNNAELRYKNEPARHKLLDVLGDLTLAGMPIKAKIICNRPGHKTNVDFAKIIKQKIKERDSIRILFKSIVIFVRVMNTNTIFIP